MPTFRSNDLLAKKNYSINPYAYCSNNPIKFIDPTGKDGYLIIWSTSGRIGHAGFAVDNYKQEVVRNNEGNVVLDKYGNPSYEMVPDGTITYYDIWPGNEGGVGKKNVEEDMKACYKTIVTTLDEISTKDITGNEKGKSADGIIKISSGYANNKNVHKILNFEKEISEYNARCRNCADFAKTGVETITGNRINAKEKIQSQYSTTPNKLYRETLRQQGTQIIKNPGNKVNKNFIKGLFNF